MSNDTLLRSTAHPPCPEDQEILEVTVPTDRKELALTDRISVRLGLWLLMRAQRPRKAPARTMTHEEVMRMFETTHISERESLAILAYQVQHHLR
ncbi:hypothetical protein [Microbacterium murale]|uniref:Uncharacterized protein n=1 Tax=Microbacterium murale TaxID=1081040 RepID=A0ABU0PDE9_9MICO|nr:hypothetical protein [Microbacterium murale]MDQ0645361.1 hypothetical protein [Microbacterium murale]